MSGTTNELDLRLLQVSFEVSGQLFSFDQNFGISAKGSKYANALMNECVVSIAGLDDKTRNYIISETSPFNRNRTAKTLTLRAGRVSTGLSLVYQGDITIATVAAPPEITLTLKCGTAHFMKGKIGSATGGSNQKLSVIASRVASNLGLSLNNQATDKTIANYTHSGNALDEVVKLQDAGTDAYVDDTQLVLKDAYLPLSGDILNLSINTGMLGVPNITEQGLKIEFFYNSGVKLGGAINVTSIVNPTCNGTYVIYKLNFALTSRGKEFQYMAECLKAVTDTPTATGAGASSP
jgi:predicted outer membrane repeat protein